LYSVAFSCLQDQVNFTCLTFCVPRYVWESKADGAFAISEDTWNEPLGRGTEIRLHLRDEAQEYLDEFKLKVSMLDSFFLCCTCISFSYTIILS